MGLLYRIRTYGCQMNVHDSEKVANLLHHAGLRPAEGEDAADVLLVNTCSIREKAEHRLYSDLGALRDWKAAVPGRVLGVGGCVAQQQGDALLRRFPHLDFVFGTHNVRLVVEMLRAALQGVRQCHTEESASPERFLLPERHPKFSGTTPGRAFVTVIEGCDMFCSFCIVPRTRGREISRPARAIVEESRQLAEAGVREITLLGQTVNAYGRHDQRRGQAGAAGTCGFAELLREIARLPGLQRLRYTSPHPIFFDAALVRAHSEVPELCPHVHLPAQSGSDRILAAMRRRYTGSDLRRLAKALRSARPGLALTTDLIVGFPGETEADFRATLELVREVGFVDSYSFKFSPRPGTQAAALGDPVAPEEAQERLERLQTLQRTLTLAAHRARVGETARVLVEGRSARARRSATSNDLGEGAPIQLQGRDPYHRVVNFSAPSGQAPREGEFVELEIVEATPHSLIGILAAAAGRLKEPLQVADEPGAPLAAL